MEEYKNSKEICKEDNKKSDQICDENLLIAENLTEKLEINEGPAANIQIREVDFMFPIYGMTIGKTTIEEIKKIHSNVEKNSEYDYFNINDINFWVNSGKYFDHLYIIQSGKLPEIWNELNINFSNSYNVYLEVLTELFGHYSIIDEPCQEYWDYIKENCFMAKIAASFYVEKKLCEIKLDFNYSVGNEDSTNTLYSINVLLKDCN